MNRTLAILIALLGIIAIVIGGVFVFQGVIKNNLIIERMKTEKVQLALDPNDPNKLTEITNGQQAQAAADLISGHRRAIAPSYQDLLGEGRFDPTNPKHLTYAQAMNMENYLYLAVTAFGLTQVVLAAGAFMLVVGIALTLTGLVLYRIPIQVS
jgi:amino acid transporter